MLEKTLKSGSPCFSTQIILWKKKLANVSIARPSNRAGERRMVLEEMNCNLAAKRKGGKGKELKAGVDNMPSFCEYRQLRDTHILYFKITAFIRHHLGGILILQSVLVLLKRSLRAGWHVLRMHLGSVSEGNTRSLGLIAMLAGTDG